MCGHVYPNARRSFLIHGFCETVSGRFCETFFVRLALWHFHFSSDRFCSMSNETFCCRSSWITGSFQRDLRWDKNCTIRVDQMSLRNIQFCLLRKFHSQYSHPNLKTILNLWISKTSLKHLKLFFPPTFPTLQKRVDHLRKCRWSTSQKWHSFDCMMWQTMPKELPSHKARLQFANRGEHFPNHFPGCHRPLLHENLPSTPAFLCRATRSKFQERIHDSLRNFSPHFFAWYWVPSLNSEAVPSAWMSMQGWEASPQLRPWLEYVVKCQKSTQISPRISK